MKTKFAYFALVLIVAVTSVSISCTRKVATVQPGYKPPVLKPYYGAGVLTLNPGEQGGKTLPISYATTPDGERIICKLDIDKLKAGDEGSINWMLKNAGYSDAQLILAADVAASLPSIANGEASLNYIGIKLKNDDSYVLGNSATFVPLSKLAPFLHDQYRILPGGAVTFYELEWQVPQSPLEAGPDGVFGTTDDIPVDTATIQQDKSELDISFGLVVPDSAE